MLSRYRGSNSSTEIVIHTFAPFSTSTQVPWTWLPRRRGYEFSASAKEHVADISLHNLSQSCLCKPQCRIPQDISRSRFLSTSAPSSPELSHEAKRIIFSHISSTSNLSPSHIGAETTDSNNASPSLSLSYTSEESLTNPLLILINKACILSYLIALSSPLMWQHQSHHKNHSLPSPNL